MHEGTSVLDLQVRQPILMEWCELEGLKTAHGRCLVRAPQLATRRGQGQRRQTACVELQVYRLPMAGGGAALKTS